MSFIHSLLNFESNDVAIVTAALQKILKHSWYLVKETEYYGLFYDDLHEEYKIIFFKNFFLCQVQTLFVVNVLT